MRDKATSVKQEMAAIVQICNLVLELENTKVNERSYPNFVEPLQNSMVSRE